MSNSSGGSFGVNGAGKRSTRRRQASGDKLSFHQLEDRRLLATFSVNNLADGPIAAAGDLPGSLRQAVFDANANPGADAIEFDASVFTGGASSLIRLTSGELEITEELTIDGSTGVDVTITGDANGNDVTNSLNITDVAASGDALLADNSRVFNFSAISGTLHFDGVTVTGGRTTVIESDIDFDFGSLAVGGGIRASNGGNVTLTDSVVSGNSTAGGGADGGGIAVVRGYLTLTDSTVSGNSTAASIGSSASGGGIFVGRGDVTLTNSTVSGNSTTGSFSDGGGIAADHGDLTLINSDVSGNSTMGGGDGGGIDSSTGDVTLINSTVRGNSTAGSNGEGGGISAGSGDLTLTNSDVSGNSTAGRVSRGGGISASFNSSVILTDSTVSGNSTAGDRSDGGGISAIGDVTLINSTVSGNRTAARSSNAGGVDTRDGDVILINSTVSGNSTEGVGGGITSDAGNVALTNSTVSGNTANEGDGGGIFAGEGDVTLSNSTVTSNIAAGADSEGGGIFAANALTIMNSIVAGNTGNGTAPDFRAPDDLSNLTVSFSLIGDNTGTGLTEAETADSNGNLIGSNAASIDPLLGPLSFNGGPTQTHALLPGSPALDAGNDAGSSSLAIDQRGQSRDVDLPGVPNVSGVSFTDIGSFERQVNEPLGVLPVVTSFVRDEGGVLARPDLLGTFSVSFSADVNVGAKDLTVRNDTIGGRLVDTSGLTVDYDGLTNTATWDFSSLVLDPSFYSFELSDRIVSVAGNLGLEGDVDGSVGGVYEIGEVYVALPGDANLDGQVDVLGDAALLVNNLGTSTGAVWTDGDFNEDGEVDVLGDASILVDQLGQSVMTLPAGTPFLVSNLLDGPVTAAGDLPGSLRQAVFDANAFVGANTIAFVSSVFTGGASSLIRLTSGELEITEELTIDGSTGVNVTITGDANGNDVTDSLNITDVAASGDALLADNSRVFNFVGTSETLQLDGLTVTGGRTTADGAAGGGISLNDGDLTLTNSTVSGNSTAGSSSNGGGISASFGDLTLTGSTVNGNRTAGDGASGGGISASEGDVTLTNTAVSGNSANEADGGGIFANRGDVTLTNSIVSGNNTTARLADGGGISVYRGDLTLTETTVSGNSTAGDFAEGGGIFTHWSDVTLIESTVSGNSTAGNGAEGGGLHVITGNLTLTNSTVTGNTTTGSEASGGGIFASSTFDVSDVTLTNSTVSGNSTAGEDAGGGGIFANVDYLNLFNSTVSGNSTTGETAKGGGIYADEGTVGFNDSTVSGNSTAGDDADGGGIFANNGLDVTFTNSTVSGNSTSGEDADGGGIFVDAVNLRRGSLALINSTVSDNSATGEGGGVGSSGQQFQRDLTITNSIVAGNTDNGTAPDFQAIGDLAVGFSLIGDNTGTTLTEAQTAGGSGNLIGSNAAPIDPLLGPLAFNGGSTQTHALLPGSPAIDAGNSPLATDQRGESRGVDLPEVPDASGGNFSDIGSFELQLSEPVEALTAVTSFASDEGGVFARPANVAIPIGNSDEREERDDQHFAEQQSSLQLQTANLALSASQALDDVFAAEDF